METNYLLLRNNRQSGPFRIGELLQQSLRSSDMIWVEGKSTAWCYLDEMEFSFHKPEVLNVPAKRESAPLTNNDEIERKAEEIRQRVLAYTPSTFHGEFDMQSSKPGKESEIEADDFLGEEIPLVTRRKEKRMIAGEMIMTLIVIGIFGAGFYSTRSMFETKPDVMVPEATVVSDSHEGWNKNAATTVSLPVQSGISAVYDSVKMDSMEVRPVAVLKKKATAVLKTPVLQQEVVPVPEVKEPPVSVAVAKVEPKPVIETKVSSDETAMSNTAAEPEKKKGFLRGLFKKHRKDKEETEVDK